MKYDPMTSWMNQLRRSFSASAYHYEAFSALQAELGRELLKQFPWDQDGGRILDVGMGTGRSTRRLKLAFPDSRVVGLDFAWGMLKAAQGKDEFIPLVQADAACLPFASESFDGIYANAVYQWVRPLVQGIREVHRVLRPGGVWSATLFGGESLKELTSSLEAVMPRETMKDLPHLPSEKEISQAMAEAGMTILSHDTEKIHMHFPSVLDLLKWLKKIGARVPMPRFFPGPRRLAQVETYYQEHFSDGWGLQVTFEVFWINAQKKGHHVPATAAEKVLQKR